MVALTPPARRRLRRFALPPLPAAAADARLEAQKAAFLAMPEADRSRAGRVGLLDFYNGASTAPSASAPAIRSSPMSRASARPDGSSARRVRGAEAARSARAAVDFALIDDRIPACASARRLSCDQAQTFERRHDLASATEASPCAAGRRVADRRRRRRRGLAAL